MFSKVASILVLALGAVSVSAVYDSCNTSSVQCCGSLHSPASYDVTQIATLVGVAVSNISGQVGLECNPINDIAIGSGADCSTTPVCCEKKFSNQLVGVNCSPVEAAL